MAGNVTIVAVKGPGGKYGRPDAPNTGPWATLGRGWRGFVFDRDAPDDDCRLEMTKPDQRFQLRHAATGTLLGLDGTRFATSVGDQFYCKPEGEGRGGYEAPCIYEGNLNGGLQGVVEYDDERGKYYSCAFAVEVLA